MDCSSSSGQIGRGLASTLPDMMAFTKIWGRLHCGLANYQTACRRLRHGVTVYLAVLQQLNGPLNVCIANLSEMFWNVSLSNLAME